MTPAYRYEETENTRRLVRFDANDQPVVRVYARCDALLEVRSLRLSRRERRAEARRGAGKRRQGARPVSVWRTPRLTAATEMVTLVGHLFRFHGVGLVLLYLPTGVTPTPADERALMVACGASPPTLTEIDSMQIERAIAERDAMLSTKPNLPAWW